MNDDLSFLLRGDVRVQSLLDIAHAAVDPTPFRTEVLHDAAELIKQINLYILDLEEQLRSPKLTRLAREKLKSVLENYKKHLSIMSKQLSPLGLTNVTLYEHKVFSSRRKVGQRLIEYYGNIARDWAWGVQENLNGLHIIQQVAQKSKIDLGKIKRILVLGAGACRLPYEVHRWIRPEVTICADYNPLLLSIARKLIQKGETLNHIDFPNVPTDVESYAVPYELKAPETLHSDFKFLIHDITEWGFQENAVDLILTPWIIDIIPVLPPRLFAQINSALKPGGFWINYGPLNFSRQRLVDNWTKEEIINQVARSGFEETEYDYSQVPHLQNPRSAQGRMDYVLTFCTQKISSCEIPQDPALEHLPGWMTNPDLPIDAPLALNDLQASLQLSFEISKKIDEKMTLRELANFFAERYQIPIENAMHLIKNTLLGWIASNRFNPMR